MSTQPKPSAGALNAVRACLKWAEYSPDEPVVLLPTDPDSQMKLAQLIDTESGLAELLKAASWLVDCAADLGADDIQLRECRTAIAKATNPNAETVQAYPKGRWTEKGTV